MWVFHLWARGSIYVLCIGRIFLFWVCQSCCGGDLWSHSTSWIGIHIWAGIWSNMYFVSEPIRSLHRIPPCICICPCVVLLLVRCWLQTKLSLKAESQQQNAAVGWKQVSTKKKKKGNRSSCRMTNGRLIFSLTAMYFWNCTLAVDQVFRRPQAASRMIMSALKWRKGGKIMKKKKRMEIAVTWYTSDCSC